MKNDRTNLLRTDGKIDARAVMRDAHRQHKIMSRLGWSWAQCVSYAWRRAKGYKEIGSQRAA